LPAAIPSEVRSAILIGACLLLLAQALALFSVRWVEDESWYAVTAKTLVNRGETRAPIFQETAGGAQVDPRPPVPFFVMGAFFKVLGTSVRVARLPFLLSALACLFLTYLLGCELGRPWVGLLGALALATDNLFFWAARTARPESMATAFALLGILFYLRSRRKDSVMWALLGGLTVGVGVLVHLNAFAAALSAGVFALIEFGWSIVRRGRPWAFAAGLLLPVLLFIGWGMQDTVHKHEFLGAYAYGEGHPLREIPQLEASRYRDFLGMSSLRVNVPIHVPTRLHIVLALLFSAFLLYRWDRALLGSILCLLLPAMVWWAYERNMTPRYIATGAPYLALLLAGAAAAVWQFRPAWRKAAVVCGVLVLLSQVAGNYLLLYVYRNADYDKLSRQLRSVIPDGACVYGAITFWITFHDRQYYAWNRTPVQYAVDHGARYLVLNDRVLLHGSGSGTDDWVDRRHEVEAFVKDNAVLVGHAPNSFYGDLEIYRVKDAAGGTGTLRGGASPVGNSQ
jgi:4-amino-4-deoxy-L-arabinose transferase-like glycosyltransferase